MARSGALTLFAALAAACAGSSNPTGSGASAGAAGAGGSAGSGSPGGAGGAGGTPSCTTPNPQGCKHGGCPSGSVCDTELGCEPSTCSCLAGSWGCTADCAGGSCVPVGETCVSKSQQIAAEVSQTLGTCTSVVRLAYTSLEPVAWQLVCGKPATLDEAAARAVSQAATGYGETATLLSGPKPEDQWVFWEQPSDYGGVGVVSARSGLAVFGAAIVYSSTGSKLTYPPQWRDVASLGFSCRSSSSTPAPSARGFDLATGKPLDAATTAKPLVALWSSALPAALSTVHSLLDVVVLHWAPNLGPPRPETAEYVVLLSSS